MVAGNQRGLHVFKGTLYIASPDAGDFLNGHVVPLGGRHHCAELTADKLQRHVHVVAARVIGEDLGQVFLLNHRLEQIALVEKQKDGRVFEGVVVANGVKKFQCFYHAVLGRIFEQHCVDREEKKNP